MPRIGADHLDVSSTAGSFDLAGQLAGLTGQQAAIVARDVDLTVTDLERALIDQVHQLADQLRRRVADHAATLAATDWEGASKQQALAVEQALGAEVAQLLADATATVEAFGTAVREQATTYRLGVEGDLRVAMQLADERYLALAAASRHYLGELQAADQTIRAGG